MEGRGAGGETVLIPALLRKINTKKNSQGITTALQSVSLVSVPYPAAEVPGGAALRWPVGAGPVVVRRRRRRRRGGGAGQVEVVVAAGTGGESQVLRAVDPVGAVGAARRGLQDVRRVPQRDEAPEGTHTEDGCCSAWSTPPSAYPCVDGEVVSGG